MEKSSEKILAEMEYLLETIEAKELELSLLKKKMLKLQMEFVRVTKRTNS